MKKLRVEKNIANDNNYCNFLPKKILNWKKVQLLQNWNCSAICETKTVIIWYSCTHKWWFLWSTKNNILLLSLHDYIAAATNYTLTFIMLVCFCGYAIPWKSYYSSNTIGLVWKYAVNKCSKFKWYFLCAYAIPTFLVSLNYFNFFYFDFKCGRNKIFVNSAVHDSIYSCDAIEQFLKNLEN